MQSSPLVLAKYASPFARGTDNVAEIAMQSGVGSRIMQIERLRREKESRNA